jgi:hypothetical protein
VADRDLLASLSLGILRYAQAQECVGGKFSSPLLRSSDMDAYLRSQELAGSARVGLVSWIGLGYVAANG